MWGGPQSAVGLQPRHLSKALLAQRDGVFWIPSGNQPRYQSGLPQSVLVRPWIEAGDRHGALYSETSRFGALYRGSFVTRRRQPLGGLAACGTPPVMKPAIAVDMNALPARNVEPGADPKTTSAGRKRSVRRAE